MKYKILVGLLYIFIFLQMVELVPGSRIFLYQTHLEEAERKKSGTATARYLLSCFYSPSELMAAGNLTGKNDKRGLDGDIIDAIVGMQRANLLGVPA